MPSTRDFSDCGSERIASHNDHDNSVKTFPPSSHKRVNSVELGEVGAQFRLPKKQNSIPRPPYIDIVHDEVVDMLQHSTAGDMALVTTSIHEQRPACHVRSEGGSPSAPSALIAGTHRYSKEDVALLIYHRDKEQDRTARRDPPSEASHESTRDVAPSMTEDHDNSEARPPSSVTRALTESSRPRTPSPPPPSVTTSIDDYRIIGRDPNTSPWSSLKRRREGLESEDE